MTDPVFLATPVELHAAAPGSVVLVSGDEARHALKVRRLRVGESIHLVDGEGRRVAGDIAAPQPGVDPAVNVLCVQVVSITDEPPPQPRLTIVQALVKGDRAERAVESMTEAGVDEIVPWESARSVVRWSGAKAERGRARWEAIAREATKQSRRARIPVVAPAITLAELCKRVSAADIALLLDTSGLPIRDHAVEGDVVIIVGPEGGFGEDETADLVAAGAKRARLGPEILRSSTAGTVAIAAILVSSSRWA